MTDHGFEVHVVAAPDGTVMGNFAATEGAIAHEVFMTRAMTPLTDAQSLLHLFRIIKALAPHIVHAGTPKGGFVGIVAAFVLRIPVRIYHMHGIRGMTATGWRRPVLMAAEWLTCRLASRVLCVSHSTRDSAIAAGLCAPEKIVVLGAGSCNGVDGIGRFDPARWDGPHRAQLRARLQLPAESKVLGFVGRVVREKGVVELAAAWETLAARDPDLHLVIVGPVEGQDPVPAEVLAALRSHPRVRMLDAVADPAPYYAVMDVVTLPSYREGLPNVPLEAAAMCLPVVATRVPGCVDAVLDGVTGTLVAPYSVEPLVDAIAAYLNSPELRGKHGRSARERVLRDFVPEQLWGRVLRLYRQEMKTTAI